MRNSVCLTCPVVTFVRHVVAADGDRIRVRFPESLYRFAAHRLFGFRVVRVDDYAQTDRFEHHLHVSARVAADQDRPGLNKGVERFGFTGVLRDRTHRFVGDDPVADAGFDSDDPVDRNPQLFVDKPLVQ